jgi:hypothetical protein
VTREGRSTRSTHSRETASLRMWMPQGRAFGSRGPCMGRERWRTTPGVIGVYSTVAYAVAGRIREFGARASPSALCRAALPRSSSRGLASQRRGGAERRLRSIAASYTGDEASLGGFPMRGVA